MRPPVNLDQLKQSIADADAIPVEAGGRTFIIRPPHLLSDEEYQRLVDTDDTDMVSQARIMIDDYDGFTAAGGSALLVAEIVSRAAAAAKDEQGVTPGESEGSSGS